VLVALAIGQVATGAVGPATKGAIGPAGIPPPIVAGIAGYCQLEHQPLDGLEHSYAIGCLSTSWTGCFRSREPYPLAARVPIPLEIQQLFLYSVGLYSRYSGRNCPACYSSYSAIPLAGTGAIRRNSAA